MPRVSVFKGMKNLHHIRAIGGTLHYANKGERTLYASMRENRNRTLAQATETNDVESRRRLKARLVERRDALKECLKPEAFKARRAELDNIITINRNAALDALARAKEKQAEKKGKQKEVDDKEEKLKELDKKKAELDTLQLALKTQYEKLSKLGDDDITLEALETPKNLMVEFDQVAGKAANLTNREHTSGVVKMASGGPMIHKKADGSSTIIQLSPADFDIVIKQMKAEGWPVYRWGILPGLDNNYYLGGYNGMQTGQQRFAELADEQMKKAKKRVEGQTKESAGPSTERDIESHTAPSTPSA